MAKPWAAGARGTPPLHREFRRRKILALTLDFEPACLWLSAFVFTGRNEVLKTSLHCYCGEKGALKLGTVNKHTILLENSGSRVPTAAFSKSCLKNYQNNYPVCTEIMKLLWWRAKASRIQVEEISPWERSRAKLFFTSNISWSGPSAQPCPDLLSPL